MRRRTQNQDGDGMSLLEHPKSPGAEDDVAPGPSSIKGSGQLDRELPDFMNAGEDQLQTGNGSGDEDNGSPLKRNGCLSHPIREWGMESVVERSSEKICEAAHEEPCPPHKEHLAQDDLASDWGRVCSSGTIICLSMHTPNFWKP